MKHFKVLALAAAFIIATPLLAAAQQVTGSSTVDVQVQSLLSQINALEQQLHTLIQSVATSSGSDRESTSTSPMWGHSASSTPPGMSVSSGNCSVFSRNLSVGSQGDDVMQLQQVLSGDGFFSASTTGYFGTVTAKALDMFQMHFGISTSSAGFFGPLTRAFMGGRCGQGDQGNDSGHGMTGSSTPPMWQGTTTPSMHPMMPWMGSSTDPRWQGQEGSSTPVHPCPQTSSNANQSAAGALFVPHVVLPPTFLSPCRNDNSNGQ